MRPGQSPRILYLTPGCFDKGGISRYCRYQITALRDLVGADNVHVASLLGPDAGSLEGEFAVQFAAGGTSAAAKSRFIAHAGARSFGGLVPDVVLAAHMNLSPVAWAVARASRAPYVVNVYGCEVWSPHSYDAALGLRHADHVIADCHFTARYVGEHGMTAPAGGVRVVWDCVDIERFAPAAPRPEVLARYGIPDPTRYANVLTLGRVSRDAAYKGYARLVDAFVQIADLLPTARLVVAGRGDLLDGLRALAAAHGVGDRVVFTGSIHEDDLADVYRCGRVFSMVGDRGPNRGEGIPLTPLEAASCGLPLLVGDQDGSAEAVVNGETGLALDPFDVAAIARHLLALLGDPERCQRMGQAARRRIEREFSFETFRDKHRELLPAWQGAYAPARAEA